MSRSVGIGETVPMKRPSHHLIAEVPSRWSKVEITIGIDLGAVWTRSGLGSVLHEKSD
jgi:hypothetical protein